MQHLKSPLSFSWSGKRERGHQILYNCWIEDIHTNVSRITTVYTILSLLNAGRKPSVIRETRASLFSSMVFSSINTRSTDFNCEHIFIHLQSCTNYTRTISALYILLTQQKPAFRLNKRMHGIYKVSSYKSDDLPYITCFNAKSKTKTKKIVFCVRRI